MKIEDKRLLFIVLCIFVFSFAQELIGADKFQKHWISEVYKIGKTYKTVDGMTIENTLAMIMCQESSCAKVIIGDKYKNGKYKPLEKMSLGAFQMQLDTVKFIYRKQGKKIPKDDWIINKLLTDVRFGAHLSAWYFVYNYNIAVSRNYWNPWFKAVSRHNGGWNNKKYVRDCNNDLKLVKRVMKRNKG